MTSTEPLAAIVRCDLEQISGLFDSKNISAITTYLNAPNFAPLLPRGQPGQPTVMLVNFGDFNVARNYTTTVDVATTCEDQTEFLFTIVADRLDVFDKFIESPVPSFIAALQAIHGQTLVVRSPTFSHQTKTPRGAYFRARIPSSQTAALEAKSGVGGIFV